MTSAESPHPPVGSGLPPEENLRSFRRVVLSRYSDHGRDLPWRRTRDPYRILVSEVMLQQTQVSRVLQKYDDFLARFPDVCALADSPTAAVVSAWQGLGYNRRSLALQRTAQVVVSDFGGSLPRSQQELRALPGVGPATAGAIAAFAYGLAVPFIETNIRAAILHYFFPERPEVPDREVFPLVEATLDREDPRTWYYALMDYGSWLKQTGVNPSRRSKHHLVQSPFFGSRRQLRAQILRLFLTQQGEGETASVTVPAPSVSLHAAQVANLLPGWNEAEVSAVLCQLAEEGFLKEETGFSLR